MATNLVTDGDVMAIKAGDTVLPNGSPVLVGKRLAIALTNIAPNTTGAGAVVGAWRLSKAAVALGQGDIVYWDAAAAKITNVANGNTQCGYCFEAALAGSADACIKINA